MIRRALAEPVHNLLSRASIGHQSVAFLPAIDLPTIAPAVDDEIVDDAAGVVQQNAVHGLARHGLGGVVGKHALQEAQSTVARHIGDGHVRDIEHAGSAAHLLVLGKLRTVVQRHGPAGEIRHPSPGCHMRFVEWRVLVHDAANGPRPIASRTNCALMAAEASIKRTPALRIKRRHGLPALAPQ